MPNSTHNLISLGDIDNMGAKIEIFNGQMTITLNGFLIYQGDKIRNVWSTDANEILSNLLDNLDPIYKEQMWWLRDSVKIAVSEDSERFITLWHNRLGHCNIPKLLSILSTVSDFNTIMVIINSDFGLTNKCTSCSLAKSHAQPHKARTIKKSTMIYKKRIPDPNFDPKSTEQQGFGPEAVSTDTTGPYSLASFKSEYNHNFILMDSKYVFIFEQVKCC